MIFLNLISLLSLLHASHLRSYLPRLATPSICHVTRNVWTSRWRHFAPVKAKNWSKMTSDMVFLEVIAFHYFTGSPAVSQSPLLFPTFHQQHFPTIHQQHFPTIHQPCFPYSLVILKWNLVQDVTQTSLKSSEHQLILYGNQREIYIITFRIYQWQGWSGVPILKGVLVSLTGLKPRH